MSDRIRIVIVDDHPIFRAGLVQLLELDQDFVVLGIGASGGEAVSLAAQRRPDMLLLDVTMQENGIDATGAVRRASPETLVVMLTASEHEADVSLALDAGAVGYLLKGMTGGDLLDLLHEVHAGAIHVSPRALTQLISTHRGGSEKALILERLGQLSRQEQKVLRLVAEGMNNREIGVELGVQEKTVKFHLSNVFQKLNVHNRVQASLIANRGWSKTARD